MKKIFFVLMLTVITSITITSCTEDAIQPSKVESSGGPGGNGSTGKP